MLCVTAGGHRSGVCTVLYEALLDWSDDFLLATSDSPFRDWYYISHETDIRVSYFKGVHEENAIPLYTCLYLLFVYARTVDTK